MMEEEFYYDDYQEYYINDENENLIDLQDYDGDWE
jgi:hypothetical protein